MNNSCILFISSSHGWYIKHTKTSLVFLHTDDASVSPPPRPVGHPWRIVSAVCVQRMPSITREKTEMELRYEAMKDAIREERSRLSDFELDEAKHQEMKKERERRALEEDIDTAQVCSCDVHTLTKFHLSPFLL